MRSTFHYRWLLVLGILPLGALFDCESRASASCGDYLHILNSPAQTAGEASQPAQQHRPCHGPGCRQQTPERPTPAPVPPTTQHQTFDAVLIPPAEPIDAQSTDRLDPEVCLSCRGPADTIFHPPR